MFSCLGSKKNTRNCVMSLTHSDNLKNSKSLETNDRLQITLTKNNNAGKQQLKDIVKKTAKKIAVIKRLKQLQSQSKKKGKNKGKKSKKMKASLERQRTRTRTRRRTRRRPKRSTSKKIYPKGGRRRRR